MPSKAVPMGNVPDSSKPQIAIDAKPNVEFVETTNESAKESETDVDVTEADVAAISEKQKVPYQRFKEKNDEAKRLRDELAESQSRHQEELNRLVAEKVALQNIRHDDVMDVDMDTDVERSVKSLKQQIEEQNKMIQNLVARNSSQDLTSQINELKKNYPDLDELEVLGWKKAKPSKDLSELAELSHNRLNSRLEDKLKNILKSKKEKAKNALPLQSLVQKIQTSEKPKTVKEARSLLRRLID